MGGSSSRPAAQQPKALSVTDSFTPSLEIKPQLLEIKKDSTRPITSPSTAEVVLTNVDDKKIKFRFDPVLPAGVTLNFSPASGTIDRGRSKTVKVTVVLREKKNFNFKITLRIENGSSLFIGMKVIAEGGVFGVDPNTLEQVEDHGQRVPAVLVSMKDLLIEKGGCKTEGIFRLAGEQTEILRIKDLMNQNKFDGTTNDVNAISSLMKIWFRDLPVPILNTLPDRTIMNFSADSDCVGAFHTLPEPQKSLLSWLLDFLMVISSHASVNKMTAQNIAIVIAPNLYDISTPNPMEGLILSQKCAQFLFQLLNAKINGVL